MTAHNRLMTLWPTLLTGVMVFLLLSSLIAGERSDLIKANFSKLTTSSRGPFGPIVLQHATRRVPPRRNRIGAGFQFQAAFRNSTATKLLQNSFYAGNIFTTNYFHLYAKYVMQDENLKFFSIDDQQLLQSGVAAVNEAALIAKHMLVEKFYLDRHAGSRYSASFARRGVSGTEYETKYYDKYIRFLGQKMPSESGRLLNFLIQKRWNLMGNMGGVSLRRLRTEIDKIYKKCKWGCSSQAKSKIFAIRGVIHNAMSVEVVEMIDRFLAEHKNERMDKLRADIVRYYTVNISTIVKFARDQKRMIPAELVALLRAESQQLTLEQLERLGTIMELAVDHLRRSFNPEINHLIILLSNYLHTSVEQLYRQNQQMAGRLIPVLIDAIYAQGMLPVGEYKKMRQQLKRASSNKESVAATSTLPRMVYQRLDHLLKPAIVDWSLVYAEAEGVVDDILKSSPISLLDLMITDVKRAETSTQKYIVQTSGITYGYLKFISRDDIISKSDRFIALERRDIPIFEALPLYLAVTAGIITEEYQTELSHVKLKSDARGTPNIYYPKIRDDATLAQLISSEALVKMELTTDGTISIVVASSEEAELFWEQKRPSAIGELPLNLAEKRIRSTQDVGFSNSDSVGAKAANYAELSHLLGGRVVLEGLTIPFFYYHDFLERNPTIKNEIISTLKNRQGKFFSDRIYRNQVLSSWRKKMRDSSSKLNPQLVSKVKEWIIANYSAKSVRFRSSTNAEDLVNFNGAGLYSSTSYRPDNPKKTVERALKKVWASIWNLRAFDERQLYRIDHLKVAMGILVSPGFPNQEGEGVAVSRNIKRPEQGPAVYFNILAGEEHSVTNPTNGVTPDEILVYYQDEMRVDYLNISNQSVDNTPVLVVDQLVELTQMMVRANRHFAKLYHMVGDDSFALDFEFKIDDEYSDDGEFLVQLKQARPYIH